MANKINRTFQKIWEELVSIFLPDYSAYVKDHLLSFIDYSAAPGPAAMFAYPLVTSFPKIQWLLAFRTGRMIMGFGYRPVFKCCNALVL